LISSELRELQTGTPEYERQRARMLSRRHAGGTRGGGREERGRSPEKRGRSGAVKRRSRRGRSKHHAQYYHMTKLQRWVRPQCVRNGCRSYFPPCLES
jgi:hypothetical protein